MSQIAVVVIAFNRLNSLKRLLGSLLSADYMGDSVDLVISIDFSGDPSVLDYSKSFKWPFGKKTIVEYSENLGLKRHVLACGALTDVYENICVFEDDIYASPGFYSFAKQAVGYYGDDEKIAGISLYNHLWNPYVNRPFQAVDDGTDAYLMQIASSWGQVWSRRGWTEFVEWLGDKAGGDLFMDGLPSEVSGWSEKSWLKFHNGYLVQKNRYFVYPRISLATNFSDPGEHASESSTYQVPLLLCVKNDYAFPLCNDAVKYDAFFENEMIADNFGLAKDEVEVSLYGNKPLKKRYRLTADIQSKKIIRSYGLKLRPIELNVHFDVPGQDIFLYDMQQKELSVGSRFNASVRRFLYDIRSNMKREMLISSLVLYFRALRKRLLK